MKTPIQFAVLCFCLLPSPTAPWQSGGGGVFDVRSEQNGRDFFEIGGDYPSLPFKGQTLGF
ncbi:MAG: hypothetical protein ACREFR_10765 [Limisphaerales bacterium]